MKQDYFKVDTPKSTLIIKKNKGLLLSCQQCVLDRSHCDDICLLAGHTYHVHREIKYHGFKILYRYIKLAVKSFYNKFFH